MVNIERVGERDHLWVVEYVGGAELKVDIIGFWSAIASAEFSCWAANAFRIVRACLASDTTVAEARLGILDRGDYLLGVHVMECAESREVEE